MQPETRAFMFGRTKLCRRDPWLCPHVSWTSENLPRIGMSRQLLQAVMRRFSKPDTVEPLAVHSDGETVGLLDTYRY